MIFFKRNSNILLLISFLFIGYKSSAQTRFALVGGVQGNTTSYRIRGIKQETSVKPGFILGASYKIEFENNLYFSPILFYSYKGYKVTLNQAAYPPDLQAIKNDVSIHAIEISPLLQYDFSKDISHFFIKLGPSIEMQIAGTEKLLLIDGNTVKRSRKYGFTEYGRYSASAVIQLGYKFKNNYFAQAYYYHGLTDLNNADNGPNIKYRIAGISVGRFL